MPRARFRDARRAEVRFRSAVTRWWASSFGVRGLLEKEEDGVGREGGGGGGRGSPRRRRGASSEGVTLESSDLEEWGVLIGRG